MNALKALWSRLLTAFAVIPKGRGISGSGAMEEQGNISALSGEHAAQSGEAWKSHGGFRK